MEKKKEFIPLLIYVNPYEKMFTSGKKHLQSYKKGTGTFFSQCKRLPRFARNDILQAGLMNQAPT